MTKICIVVAIALVMIAAFGLHRPRDTVRQVVAVGPQRSAPPMMRPTH
jgi:hypothetical protein